jgi:hypothetical protein
MPANGTFTNAGFPCNGFTDIKLRKAFRALFPYNTWLNASYLGEATQPATCVADGLAYYDPSIPKPPTDRALAIKLLKEAWGGTEVSPGPVWTNGFYMSFCYNSGNEPRKMACEMFRDAFESLNSEFGTHFTGVVTEILWTDYSSKWKTRVLPFYFVGWGADFPDAHNFVVPFMETVSGAFAKFQGFSNETINTWIREGIDSIVPAFRQDRYTKLQQAFIDNCYSIAMAQPLGRHWQRTWAHGFYYHSCMAGEEYAYYRWKEEPAPARNTAATIGLAQGSSGTRLVILENTGQDTELVEYNETISDDGTPIISQIVEAWLRPGEKYANVKKIVAAGTITITATVRISSKWIYPIGTVNPVPVVPWKVEDLNYDFYVNAKDAVILGKAFNSQPGQMLWDPRADINGDGYVNAKDAVLLGKVFNWH